MDERTMEALASGEPCGSGGPLTNDHVICPGCAHNFAAISQSSRDRIAELEAALHQINALIDSPARFNAEVQAVLDSVIDTRDVKFATEE